MNSCLGSLAKHFTKLFNVIELAFLTFHNIINNQTTINKFQSNIELWFRNTLYWPQDVRFNRQFIKAYAMNAIYLIAKLCKLIICIQTDNILSNCLLQRATWSLLLKIKTNQLHKGRLPFIIVSITIKQAYFTDIAVLITAIMETLHFKLFPHLYYGFTFLINIVNR